MMMRITTETEAEISDVLRLVSVAVKAANSNSSDGYGRCVDIVRFLKSLNLSTKDIDHHSQAIHVLNSLRDHTNPKVRTEVNDLFDSWLKTLYSSSSSSTCNKAIRLNPKKKPTDLVKKNKETNQFLELKKKRDERSHALGTGETKQVDDCKSFQTQKQIPKVSPSLKSVRDSTRKSIPIKSHLTQKKSDEVKVFSKRKKTEDDESSLSYETGEIKQNLKKPNDDDCKYSFAAKKPIQKKKKQSVLPTKLSVAHQDEKIIKLADTYELFEIAKKSADVANLKGLLLAKEETSICVDALTLLIGFPISSIAKETRKIMEKLEHLTKHKDRKICNSASTLLHHWRQSITDQEHKRFTRQTQG